MLLNKFIARAPNVILHVYSLFFIFLGWLIFASDGVTLTAEQGISVFMRLCFISRTSFAAAYELSVLLGALPFIFILIIGSTQIPKRIYFYITERKAALRVMLPLFAFALSVAYIVSSGYNPFLYFRF